MHTHMSTARQAPSKAAPAPKAASAPAPKAEPKATKSIGLMSVPVEDGWKALVGLLVPISETQVNERGELSGYLSEEGARAVLARLAGEDAHQRD